MGEIETSCRYGSHGIEDDIHLPSWSSCCNVVLFLLLRSTISVDKKQMAKLKITAAMTEPTITGMFVELELPAKYGSQTWYRSGFEMAGSEFRSVVSQRKCWIWCVCRRMGGRHTTSILHTRGGWQLLSHRQGCANHEMPYFFWLQ